MKSLRVCSVGVAVYAGLAIAAAAWAAGPHEAPIRNFAKSTVEQWVSKPIVIEAIRKQNARHAGLSQGDIVATIVDPFGKRLSRLTARSDGVIIGHTQHALVNQGDAVAHIAEIDST